MKNKKWYYQALAALLGVSVCVGSFTACATETAEEIPVSLPDYSQSDKSFDFCGYVSTYDGSYTYGTKQYQLGKDSRTVEGLTDYLDAGFNVTMVRYDDTFPTEGTKEDWATSNAKKVFEVAYAAGCRKIILTDNFFNVLIWSYNLIGEGDGYQYASEAELDAAVAERLSIYKDEPGFYGLMLADEPKWQQLESYGIVYRSLRRVMPEIYLHANLHPASVGIETAMDTATWVEEHGTAPTRREAYREYLRVFFEKTGADRVAVDCYPFLTGENGYEVFRESFYPGVQIMREVCDEYGASLAFTMQSISHTNQNKSFIRVIGEAEMWLQMNALLGFGANDLYYYTYYTYPTENDGGYYDESGNFVTREGEKTNVYYAGKEIMHSVRKFEKVILNYKFQGARIFLTDVIQHGIPKMYTEGSIPFVNDYEFTLLKGITQDNDALLTTELKDETNGLYMYMIENIIDPYYSKLGVTVNTFTADFTGYDYVAEFDCGELTYVKLDDGKYTRTLSAGYAVYLIPLKVSE